MEMIIILRPTFEHKCLSTEFQLTTYDAVLIVQKRDKRSSEAQVSDAGCHVKQLKGRDYTEPTFNLEFGVGDDCSEVELSYCVGTYIGGCDVVNNEPLGGPSTVVSRVGRTKLGRLFVTPKLRN